MAHCIEVRHIHVSYEKILDIEKLVTYAEQLSLWAQNL